jgi:type IV secretory pathway TrbD component
MRDRTYAIVNGSLVALLCIVIAAWGASGYLSTQRNEAPARAAQVFARNDTLFVCDRGDCRYIEPRWTRCAKRGTR